MPAFWAKNRILFLLKKRHDYHHYGHHHHPHGRFSSGLFNSAKFAADMLAQNGYKTQLVEVVDANSIDHEVHTHKPAIVVLEALWCTPDKLRENVRLHPRVKWIVRLHSEMLFLAQEGIAIQWIRDYWKIPGVYVSGNTARAVRDLGIIAAATGAKPKRIPLFPTYYPVKTFKRKPSHNSNVLNIVCPGAIRPLKNVFTQAVAALSYAEARKKRLVFYVNSTRTEQGGDSVYKNLVNLFSGTKHQLKEVDWLDRHDFLSLLQHMDLGLQVSLTETFNISAADLVSCGVPVVTSNQIDWTSGFIHANPTSTADISAKMDRAASYSSFISSLNLAGLKKHSDSAKKHWLSELKELA